MNDALIAAEVASVFLVSKAGEMVADIATFAVRAEDSPAGASVYREAALRKLATIKETVARIEAGLTLDPAPSNVVKLEVA